MALYNPNLSAQGIDPKALGRSLQEPSLAQDTITQILARIEDLFKRATENENELENILARLGGPSPSETAADRGGNPNVPPNHVIFKANWIEQMLNAHLHNSEALIRKISAVL
jgi:hypothetical protein